MTTERSADAYRLLVDAITDHSLSTLDVEGRVITWSAGAAAIEGFTAEQIMGKLVSDTFTPEERASGRPRWLLELARREGRAEDEGERVRADGTRYWAQITVTRIDDEKGETIGFARVLRPARREEYAASLTRMLMTEQQARERLLRSFMQSPSPLAIVRGPDLVYEFANDSYVHVSRMQLPVVGTAFGATHHPSVAEIRARLVRVLRTGEPYIDPEFPIDYAATASQPAKRVWFHLAYHPLRDAEGEVEAVLMLSLDITETIAARDREVAQDNAIAELREQVHAVVESAPIMLWAIDLDGRLSVVEGTGLRRFGIEARDLVGTSVWDLLEKHPSVAANHRRALAGEDVDVVWEQGDVAFQSAYRPLRNAAGEIVGALGVSTDISERRRAEEERERLSTKLLQVQKLESLGVLAGGIAHDFNNILTVILGSASLALLKLQEGSPARGPIDDVVSSARRAADLTRQLLAYSGKAHFDVHPLDISAHVREIAHLLETTIPKMVQLRLELAEDLPATLADVAQVQQVVMNLVLNGAEAIGEGSGTVLVTTGVHDIDEMYVTTLAGPDRPAPGRYVFVEVHDTGSGIDELTKQKMFDPFFTTKFHGRGLGLAAVLGIVRGHRGAIKVYSQVGKGTTFKVLLPASDQRARAQTVTRAASFRGEGLILFVDDEPEIRRAGRHMLEHFGFDVIEAADGREAVALFREHASDVRAIVLDMTMPNMSGEEAFRELRRVRADIAVILSSGYNEIEATRRFTSKGLAGFLQKPYSPDALAEKLEAALREVVKPGEG